MKIPFIFYHLEWTDIVFFDIETQRATRKNHTDEGKYEMNQKECIIYWDNWDIPDKFIKTDNVFYEKTFYQQYLSSQKKDCIEEIQCIGINKETIFILDPQKNICYDKYNICDNGHYIYNEDVLVVFWTGKDSQKWFLINKIYYEYSFIGMKINNKNNVDYSGIKDNPNMFNELYSLMYDTIQDLDEENKNKMKLLLFNNIFLEKKEFYFQKDNGLFSYSTENMNYDSQNEEKKNYSELNNNNSTLEYNMINNLPIKTCCLVKESDIEIIETNEIYNISLSKKEYLNIENFLYIYNQKEGQLNHIEDVLQIFFSFNVRGDLDLIQKENLGKPCILTLVEWAYPPFGGGENWIMNVCQMTREKGYVNYVLYFSDPINNKTFDEITLINKDYATFIQMPKKIDLILKMIYYLKPVVIHHQGANRLDYMKIANLFEIPFLTGLCFWESIIKYDRDNINIQMLSSSLTKSDDFNLICENSHIYVASNFVNDVINKLYNTRLDVIETISLENDYFVTPEFDDAWIIRKYVVMINCHRNKGGYLIEYLCNHLTLDVGLMFIYTEHDPLLNCERVEELIEDRNRRLGYGYNKVIRKKIDVKDIYKQCRILITPSLCDETFCRVAYEGMKNGIPILSSMNGNLRYLVKDYAQFIDDYDFAGWKNTIEDIYFNKEKVVGWINRKPAYEISSEHIQQKMINKINLCKESKYKKDDKNVGFIIPWADQGLGIQGREYYITMKKLGYNPIIFSFKPYHSSFENPKLQSSAEEWNFENIFYSGFYREYLPYDELIDFVYKNKISKVIIPEACFEHIFHIVVLLKLIKVKTYLVINMECLRMEEVNYHFLFDYILTNNRASYEICRKLFHNKTCFLGFHLNHPYFENPVKHLNLDFGKIKSNPKPLKFCCIGGLNSISRKNIDKAVQAFYDFSKTHPQHKFELTVYIQGIEIPVILTQYNSESIKYVIYNETYKKNVENYLNTDIFIHFGSHEGLGLGFYESLYMGTPILTIDWIPNSEIVKENINGWLVKCSHTNLYDNLSSLLHRASIEAEDIKYKLIKIFEDKENTIKILKNTYENKAKWINENKVKYEENWKMILTRT